MLSGCGFAVLCNRKVSAHLLCEALSAHVLCSWNVFDNTSNVTDCLGHGSALASIAAGSIFGVAKAANIIGVKVLDCGGHGQLPTCPQLGQARSS